ncbi:MAG: hypothetical protein PHW75_01450 [Patescibacteria group bacterium]|nr:hypothetical protein [Patescibacteria group bacterium]
MKNKQGLSNITIILIIAGVVAALGATMVAGYFFWYKPNYIDRTELVESTEPELTLVSDSPHIKTFNNNSYSGNLGWWVRGNNEWVEFAFTDIDTVGVVGDELTLKMNLGVTNKLDGDENMDGQVDLMINPYNPEKSLNYMDVLLKNKNREQTITSMLSGGTYETTYEAPIRKDLIINGTLIVRLYRHVDTNGAPDATGKSGKIVLREYENGTSEYVIPTGVYEDDDSHTVHLNVQTIEGDKTKAAPGEAVLYGYR